LRRVFAVAGEALAREPSFFGVDGRDAVGRFRGVRV
jgi:hypothetical protein